MNSSQAFWERSLSFSWFIFYVFNGFFILFFFQDSRGSKAAPMSPEMDQDEIESPMPHPSQTSQAVRRRGAISAEPITEEDVATYVKKVNNLMTTWQIVV